MVWLDSHDELFATEVGWFMTVKPGAEPALPTLRKVEAELRDAEAEALNQRLLKPTSGTIAITNGDLFDSERGVMRPRTTVIVRGDRIVAVGPADSVAVPAGATVIDATGKTVMPGLWDMHGHMQVTSQSQGGADAALAWASPPCATSASDLDVAVVAARSRGRRARSRGRERSSPASSTARARGPGPTPNIVRTEAEARAWVAHYDSTRLQADQALQPRAPRPRADDRRRGAQARHAT